MNIVLLIFCIGMAFLSATGKWVPNKLGTAGLWLIIGLLELMK